MKQRGFEIITDYKDQGIAIPERATKGAAGYDFEAKRNRCCTKYLAITSTRYSAKTRFGKNRNQSIYG